MSARPVYRKEEQTRTKFLVSVRMCVHRDVSQAHRSTGCVVFSDLYNNQFSPFVAVHAQKLENFVTCRDQRSRGQKKKLDRQRWPYRGLDTASVSFSALIMSIATVSRARVQWVGETRACSAYSIGTREQRAVRSVRQRGRAQISPLPSVIARRPSLLVHQKYEHGRYHHLVPVRSSMDDDAYDDEDFDGPEASDEEEFTYVLGGDGLDLFDNGDPSMRLYLDSADYNEWKKWSETGMFYGFTTNPTILKRDGVKCTLPSIRQMTRLAFELDIEELQLQAWGETVAEMYSNALDLAELDTRVVVKVPMTMDGIQTARRLVNDEVPVTFTAVYSVHQVVTALSVGAQYIAPYVHTHPQLNGMQSAVSTTSLLDLT